MVIEVRAAENYETEPSCTASFSCLDKPVHYYRNFLKLRSTNKNDSNTIACFLGRLDDFDAHQ